MGILMNAFIANVIKPNITRVQDEADSTALTETGNGPLLSASGNWLETVSHRLVYKDLCLPTQNESFPS